MSVSFFNTQSEKCDFRFAAFFNRDKRLKNAGASLRRLPGCRKTGFFNSLLSPDYSWTRCCGRQSGLLSGVCSRRVLDVLTSTPARTRLPGLLDGLATRIHE
jgi:hypothetical protein